MSQRTQIQQFFSIADVAEALGLSTKTVRRLVAAGALKAHKIGKQLRISDYDYRAFVALRRTSI